MKTNSARLSLITLFVLFVIACFSCSSSDKSESESKENTVSNHLSGYGKEKDETKKSESKGTANESSADGISMNAAGFSGALTADQSKTDLSTGTKPSLVSEHAEGQKIAAMMIRNAQIRFQVKDFQKCRTSIENLVKQNNAYISNETENNSAYQHEGSLQIRVPNIKFDNLVDDLMKEALYINNKNITAEDVTAEYTDIENRLKTKEEVLQRYIEILRQAKTIPEILGVEEKLRVIREEIEAAKGKMKFLKDQVSYSTINLGFYVTLDYRPEPDTGFFYSLERSLNRGWKNLLGFVVGVFSIWPWIIVITVLYFVVRRKIRKMSKKA